MTTERNIHRASDEWACRPDDQRFLSLVDLEKAVRRRKMESTTISVQTRKIRMVADDESNSLGAVVVDSDNHESLIQPTHWSADQLALIAQAPPAYLRSLPASLAARNIQHGLDNWPVRPDVVCLVRKTHDDQTIVRGFNTPSYGRIWDAEVAQAVIRVNQDGRWKIPHATYTDRDPKKATTLYASDRDIFIFLVDPDHPVEVDGKQYSRGFYTWNSEVGGMTFGLCTFLYSYICDNRIIWGATDIEELRIRHNQMAPSRFIEEGPALLQKYTQESPKGLVEGIKKAQAKMLPAGKGKDEKLVDWLREKANLTIEQAEGSIEKANIEEGQSATLWAIVQGITAFARSVTYANERVELEEKAGKLMRLIK